jgi:hypothetical protein
MSRFSPQQKMDGAPGTAPCLNTSNSTCHSPCSQKISTDSHSDPAAPFSSTDLPTNSRTCIGTTHIGYKTLRIVNGPVKAYETTAQSSESMESVEISEDMKSSRDLGADTSAKIGGTKKAGQDDQDEIPTEAASTNKKPKKKKGGKARKVKAAAKVSVGMSLRILNVFTDTNTLAEDIMDKTTAPNTAKSAADADQERKQAKETAKLAKLIADINKPNVTADQMNAKKAKGAKGANSGATAKTSDSAPMIGPATPTETATTTEAAAIVKTATTVDAAEHKSVAQLKHSQIDKAITLAEQAGADVASAVNLVYDLQRLTR